MIEYYGWVTIWDAPLGESDDRQLLRIVEDVRSLIKQIQHSNRILELQCINGRCIVITAGSTNHKTKDVTDIIDLFRTISDIAPGSYGLLYLLDDEDPQGQEDEFQVFKIARGKMSKEKDNLLSPCETTIFSPK